MFDQVIQRTASAADQRSGASASLSASYGADARAKRRGSSDSQNHVSG
jgi:hypothetical protein